MSGYDFSATINARTTLGRYFRLFPFLYFVPRATQCAVFSPRSSRSRPFSRLLRAAKCTAVLIPLQEKPDNRIYLYSRLGYKCGACMRRHTVNRIYRATITPWFANLPHTRSDTLPNTAHLASSVRDTLYVISGEKRTRHWRSWSNFLNTLTPKSYRSTYIISSVGNSARSNVAKKRE